MTLTTPRPGRTAASASGRGVRRAVLHTRRPGRPAEQKGENIPWAGGSDTRRPLSRRLHLPPDVAEEATHARGRFALYEGPDRTLHEAGDGGVRGDRLREAHPRAVLRRPLENDRAADVCVVALDWEALEADPVDAVALIARGVAGHHAHRAGGALPGDEAEVSGPTRSQVARSTLAVRSEQWNRWESNGLRGTMSWV